MIHRIWLGASMPDHLRPYGESWRRHHPDWEHLMWTEDNLPPLRNEDLFARAGEIAPGDAHRLRSDIVRYEILARQGGVYVDCDFESLRPLDPLLDGIRCFVVRETPPVINNAILGAEPRHRFIEALVTGLRAYLAARDPAGAHLLSGPSYITDTYPSFRDAVTVLPTPLFYPYLYKELDRGGESFPGAYAAHHWESTRRALGLSPAADQRPSPAPAARTTPHRKMG